MVRKRTSLGLATITLTALLMVPDVVDAGGVDYSLQDLLGGQSMTIGSMTYTNFSNFSSISYGGQRVDPSKVTVVSYLDGNQFGLTFYGQTQFALVKGQTQLTHFEYDIVTEGPDHISGANLYFATSSNGKPGAASIIARVTGIPDGLIVSTVKEIDSVSKDLASPLTRVHVSEDIVLDAKDGAITIDCFSETISEAPEPATLILLGFGALGMLTARRPWNWKRTEF